MRGDAREAEHDVGEAMHCPHCLVVMPPASGFCTACGRIPSYERITLWRTLRVIYGLVLAIGTIGWLLMPAVMAWVPVWLVAIVFICFIIGVLHCLVVEAVADVRKLREKAARSRLRLMDPAAGRRLAQPPDGGDDGRCEQESGDQAWARTLTTQNMMPAR